MDLGEKSAQGPSRVSRGENCRRTETLGVNRLGDVACSDDGNPGIPRFRSIKPWLYFDGWEVPGSTGKQDSAAFLAPLSRSRSSLDLGGSRNSPPLSPGVSNM
mgnify:FL=1